MNDSETVSNWNQSEIDQFLDMELTMDAELYQMRIETTWLRIEPVL